MGFDNTLHRLLGIQITLRRLAFVAIGLGYIVQYSLGHCIRRKRSSGATSCIGSAASTYLIFVPVTVLLRKSGDSSGRRANMVVDGQALPAKPSPH